MPMTHIAHGYLTAIQEDRFRLVTDDGQGLVLTLAKNAPVDLAELAALQARLARVTVHYTGDPNLETGIAHALMPSIDA